MIYRALKSLILFGFASGVFFVALAAVAGLLAYVLWPLDIFNHFQPILFIGTFFLSIMAAILARYQPFRGLMLSVCATGFVASSLVIVPEFVGAYLHSDRPALGDDAYKLMTFNIYAKNDDFDALYDAVEAENPDFLLIQEYWIAHRKGLSPRLEEKLPYFFYCQGGKRSFLGIYSRFPISPVKGHDCVTAISAEQRHSVIAVKVQVENPFTLLTTHFDWPIPADRQFLQMDKVAEAINKIDGPLVMAGDFNSTPFSFAFKNFVQKSGLERAAWLLPTWPAPPTYPVDMPAWLQLDHILTRGNIATGPAHRGQNGGSDHYPLVVDFSVMEQNSEG